MNTLMRYKGTILSREYQIRTHIFVANMLSDNTFRRIGHFEEDTSNVDTPYLRFDAKVLLKSVSRPLYTMVVTLLYNAYRKCTSCLPLLWHPNVCIISLLPKWCDTVRWPDNATKAELNTERKSLIFNILNYYNTDDYAVRF